MSAIYGSHADSVGMMIAGYYMRNSGFNISGPFTAVGWMKDRELVGQAIFNNYTGANLDIHLYAPRVISRRSLKEIYNYVFNVAKCERLTAKVYCNNEKLLQLLERLGFVYECTQERYFRQDDKIIDAEVYKLFKETVPAWVKL